MENFEISDDAGLLAYLMGFVEEVFSAPLGGFNFKQTYKENARDFEKLGEHITDIEAAARVAKFGPGFFGEGALDRDLRRIGFSTDGGRL